MGMYSEKSAYAGFLQGMVNWDLGSRFGSLGPLENASSSCGWSFVIGVGRQIGLPGEDSQSLTSILLSPQEESINELLLSCIFAYLFWFHLLRRVHSLCPQLGDKSFDDWWEISVGINYQVKKGLNSIITLGAWTLWNHRNKCMFHGTSPILARALLFASKDLHFLSLAGEQGIKYPLCRFASWDLILGRGHIFSSNRHACLKPLDDVVCVCMCPYPFHSY